jgi:uncharacterized protein YhbP (UPF0306 family)
MPSTRLTSLAREIIAVNRYMTLATADEAGLPWATPVYYAQHDHREFFWVSSPLATHSVNLRTRSAVGIVIFDSQAPVDTGQGVYLRATAVELGGPELDRGIEIFFRGRFPDPAERAQRAMGVEHLTGSARHRLYRATAHEHSVLDPAGHPSLGSDVDYRTVVEL